MQVLCMWFHSADDCTKVAMLLRRMTTGDLVRHDLPASCFP